MKHLIRLTLLFIAVLHLSAYFWRYQHDMGLALCELDNLPHRGLGMLYSAHIAQPHRSDYAKDYLQQWLLLTLKERFLEGQRRPVVPMSATVIAKRFPENKDLQIVSKLIFMNHFGNVKIKGED